MQKLASSDRSALIRLASTLPEGDETRRAILAGLNRVAIEFANEKALKKYLKTHPKADPKKHSVKKPKGRGPNHRNEAREKRWKEVNRMVSDVFSDHNMSGDASNAIKGLTDKLNESIKGLSPGLTKQVWDQAFNTLEQKFLDQAKSYSRDERDAEAYEVATEEYEKFKKNKPKAPKPPKA